MKIELDIPPVVKFARAFFIVPNGEDFINPERGEQLPLFDLKSHSLSQTFIRAAKEPGGRLHTFDIRRVFVEVQLDYPDYDLHETKIVQALDVKGVW